MHGLDVGRGAHGDECCAVFFLELAEPTPVDDAGNDVSHIESLPEVSANNSMQLRRRVQRVFRCRRRLRNKVSRPVSIIENDTHRTVSSARLA